MKVFILRTHYYSELWVKYLSEISNEMKVVIVADVSSGFFNFNGFEHIYINDTSCQNLGLSTSGNYKWRCGDYAYYLVYDKYKFDEAWMTEADVYLDCSDCLDFLKRFSKIESDFLCTYYKEADKNWYWYDKISGYDKIFSCFMPLTRLSGNVVDELLSIRVKEKGVANDEVFMATVLSHHGIVKDIDELNDKLYDNISFCYRVLKLESFINVLVILRGHSGKIYHPVTNFKSFINKYSNKSYLKGLVITLLSRFFSGNKKKLF